MIKSVLSIILYLGVTLLAAIVSMFLVLDETAPDVTTACVIMLLGLMLAFAGLMFQIDNPAPRSAHARTAFWLHLAASGVTAFSLPYAIPSSGLITLVDILLLFATLFGIILAQTRVAHR